VGAGNKRALKILLALLTRDFWTFSEISTRIRFLKFLGDIEGNGTD
jgi:hypothetical protein